MNKIEKNCSPVPPMGRCAICGSKPETSSWYCETCEERLAIKIESGIKQPEALFQMRREQRGEE